MSTLRVRASWPPACLALGCLFLGAWACSVAPPVRSPANVPDVPSVPRHVPAATEPGPASTHLEEWKAPRAFQDAPIEKVLQILADEGEVNIDYRPPNGDVRVTLTCPASYSWLDVLKAVARDADLEIQRRSQRFYVVHRSPRVTIELVNADIGNALITIASATGTSLIVGERVTGSISVHLRNVPAIDAIRTIAQTGGYVVVQEGSSWAVNLGGPR
ncbi:MAG: hypothetical protein O6952_10105 [Planctomycetota bacterium]|nr:hypothetical protein [Planctomycetota bacterium]